MLKQGFVRRYDYFSNYYLIRYNYGKEPSKKEIKVNGQILETVTKFKYLGSIISDEGSEPEILSRIAQTTAALTKLKPIWNNKNISISSKIRLLRSLVMSIFLYACESWTLNADTERRIRAMEMRCYGRLLGISYKDHITNEEVSRRIEIAIGPHIDLLTIVRQRKLKWYGHTTRSSGLAKTIMQGTVNRGRRRGWQKKRWQDNIREWTGLELRNTLRKAEDREEWKAVVRRSSAEPDGSQI
ncbi:endonuclease-reverse transcriptase [Plakobranchus ocellatus]|uniref:Endonuclease-reverse transcriptase n=1 Tax=Plakobranchus ocellatus TaxID=259542 RepID=A0AAV4CX24_9GAST|nr:endonuclease-reverse transcriptase [Plakobranchus ocellatus]